MYKEKRKYSYVISEPDLLPRCSPVSIPRVPAPPPNPTPFGPYNKINKKKELI